MTTLPETLPADLEAERSVLGAAMLETEAAGLVAKMAPADFYAEEHRLAHHAIADLVDREQPVDISTVTAYLRDQRQLETAGGAAGVSMFLDACPDVASYTFHIDRLKRLGATRTAMERMVKTTTALEAGADISTVGKVATELAELVSTATRAGTGCTITASDLMHMDLRPPRWSVEGLFPEGLCILSGAPKLGKSWLALDVCFAVAAGGLVAGSIQAHGGEALYLGLEDSQRRIRDRLVKVAADRPIPEGLHVATTMKRLDLGGLEWLRGWLDEHPNCRLVCIDTWTHVKPERRKGEDPYHADAAAAKPLQRLAQDCGVSIVVVHHNRKAARGVKEADPLEAVSGTMGLTGVADAVLVLTRGRFGGEAKLAVMGRDLEEQELALKLTDGRWQHIGDAVAVEQTAERRDLLEVLYQNGVLGVSEIAVMLDRDRDSTKKLLYRAQRQGLVEKRPTGRGNRVKWVISPDGCAARIEDHTTHHSPPSPASLPSPASPSDKGTMGTMGTHGDAPPPSPSKR